VITIRFFWFESDKTGEIRNGGIGLGFLSINEGTGPVGFCVFWFEENGTGAVGNRFVVISLPVMDYGPPLIGGTFSRIKADHLVVIAEGLIVLIQLVVGCRPTQVRLRTVQSEPDGLRKVSNGLCELSLSRISMAALHVAQGTFRIKRDHFHCIGE